MSGPGKDDVNPFADPFEALSQQAGGQNTNTTSATNAYQMPSLYAEKPPEYSTVLPPSNQTAIQPDPTIYQPKPYAPEISPIYPVQSAEVQGYSYNPQLNQTELERRAQELEAREQELNRIQKTTLKENNFPPLPSFCPMKPCYYHAIDIEIPEASQKSCKIMFYLWQFYILTLLVNFISSFALLVGGSGSSDSAGTTFGISLIYMFAFAPCSFVFWYRPIYKALRDDSSFNYMLFFMIFFFQIVWCFIALLGIPSFGTVGWINGLAQIARGAGGVGALMIITGLMWTLLMVGMILYYKRIHLAYRTSGASYEKAQAELAAGIASNKTVQNVAVESVKAGIVGTTQR